jgi:PAS domain S-box-containing protein
LRPDGPLISVAVRDITGLQRIGSAIRRQAALLDLVPGAILVRDRSNAIQYCNAAAEHMYGWTEAEAHDQVAHSLLKTRWPESLHAVDQELEASGYWEGELRHTRRDGTELVVMSRQAVRHDQDGYAVAILEN